jgi:membrane-associated protease RseP (regulator of RpoE activity)
MPDMSYFLSPDSILLISPFDNKKNCDSTKICQPFSWNDEGFETKETPFLGVTPSEENSTRGVKIGSVIEGSCAEKMGLQAGDIILEINGIATSNFDDLRADVQAIAPGSLVEIKVEREGKEKVLEGELGSKSSSTQDDFRIFHDFKGMDENGNLNYNFELDMSVDELEKYLNDMMIDLNNLLNEGANELQIMMDPFLSPEPGTLNIENVQEEDLKITEELSVVKDNLEFSSFSFMPNNENQTVKISFETESKGELELSIYDTSGAKIHVEKRTNFNGLFGKTISFATYPKGKYVLAIQVGDKRYMKKIIKE